MDQKTILLLFALGGGAWYLTRKPAASSTKTKVTPTPPLDGEGAPPLMKPGQVRRFATCPVFNGPQWADLLEVVRSEVRKQPRNPSAEIIRGQAVYVVGRSLQLACPHEGRVWPTTRAELAGASRQWTAAQVQRWKALQDAAQQMLFDQVMNPSEPERVPESGRGSGGLANR